MVLMGMAVFSGNAQEKKAFTLDDVIPGGSNYLNLIPENKLGLKWWGNECIRADVDGIWAVDAKTGEESVLVTLDEINEALANGEKPYPLAHKIKPLLTLMQASMPWGDRKVVVFQGKVEAGESNEDYMFWYDFVQ